MVADNRTQGNWLIRSGFCLLFGSLRMLRAFVLFLNPEARLRGCRVHGQRYNDCVLDRERDPVTGKPRGFPWKKVLVIVWLAFMLGAFLFFRIYQCASA